MNEEQIKELIQRAAVAAAAEVLVTRSLATPKILRPFDGQSCRADIATRVIVETINSTIPHHLNLFQTTNAGVPLAKVWPGGEKFTIPLAEFVGGSWVKNDLIPAATMQAGDKYQLRLFLADSTSPTHVVNFEAT